MLGSFENPPAFELWSNPVTSLARNFDAIGGRSLVASQIFSSCNASNLCDDGFGLIDGGLNDNRRLWLTYKFNSLTDYDGRDKYTSLFALISLVSHEEHGTELFFGFDWQRPDTLSRLIMNETEPTLKETVLNDEAWHAVHRLTRDGRRITMR